MKQERQGPVVHTLGTSNRSLEEFLSLLAEHGLKLVVDVRSWPASRRHPHFCREALERALAERGLAYRWLGRELGGHRRGGYEAHMATETFRRGLEELVALARGRPTVVVCAERLPWRCHRWHLARALEEHGFDVVHIIDRGRLWRPGRREKAPLLPGLEAVEVGA